MEIESCITYISDFDAVYLVTSNIKPRCATKDQDSTEVIQLSSVFWDTADGPSLSIWTLMQCLCFS